MHRPPHRRSLSSIAALLGLLTLAPCAVALTAGDPPPATVSDRVLDTKTARALGLATGWQARLPRAEGTPLDGLRAGTSADGASEEVYAWDDAGVVMKIDPASGELRWQSAGVFSKESTGLIDVQSAIVKGKPVTVGLGDVTCLALDERTGSELGLSPYRRIPITRAVRSGRDFVFGSRAGQLVWLGVREERIPSQLARRTGDPVLKGEQVAAIHVVPYEVQAHQIDGAIQAAPILAGASILVCSTSGEIACFDSQTRQRTWRQKLPGGIVATPSADAKQVMVACRDQYLRSMDLATGRTNWRWFTESPLERSPLLAGDIVVLQVPDLGLVALDATDGSSLNRSPIWTAKIGGDALTRIAEGLLVWDSASGTLSLVDHKSGKVRESRVLGDGVLSVQATKPVGGDLFVLMKDGRLQRCPPLTPMAAPAPSPAAPAAGEAEAPPTEAPADAAAPAEAPADGGG